MANVTAFALFNESLSKSGGAVFVPCRTVFQLNREETAAEFRRKVLIEVAQTLIENAKDIPPGVGKTKHGRSKPLDAWLNSVKNYSFGLGMFEASAAVSSAPNETTGFSESGLEKNIIEWLKEIFPEAGSGGVVCVIDNLELLRTSSAARQAVEELRDVLFTIPGIRWVVCGALGIVHGIASSPRLEGYLYKPIRMGALPEAFSQDLFRARVSEYKKRSTAFLPLDQDDFSYLIGVFRNNLRNALNACDEFCNYIASEYGTDSRDFGPSIFLDWIQSEAKNVFEATSEDLRPRTLEAFSRICKVDSFTLAEYKKLGFESYQQLERAVKELEDEDLLTSASEENKVRKRKLQVTSKGSLIEHYQSLCER